MAALTALPSGANPDWTIPQDWNRYTPAEHAVWDTLFARQTAMLEGRVTSAFRRGLDVLRLSRAGIPDFVELSQRLEALTGWRVVAVPGLVPDAVFFEHLANRRFVAGRFIRRPDQLDYLQEPDVFHDLFGHVPLLSDPAFADYMQAYGAGGLRAQQFGLIREGGGLKLYGAGIVSSFGESTFALDDPSPNRIAFDLERVMRTDYRIDDYQQSYFVIDSFEQLRRQTADVDFAPVYRRLEQRPVLTPDAILPADKLITRGTMTYAKR